jgi:hypothetical protein
VSLRQIPCVILDYYYGNSLLLPQCKGKMKKKKTVTRIGRKEMKKSLQHGVAAIRIGVSVTV